MQGRQFAVSGASPETILEAILLGRMTALSKPDGGPRNCRWRCLAEIRGARTIAKQVIEKVEAATAPFQYALSTKAGCECVAHVLQTLTDLDPEATIMSDRRGRGVRPDLPEHNA